MNYFRRKFFAQYGDKEHIDKALDSRTLGFRIAAIENPNVNKEHIDKALKDKKRYVREAAKRKLEELNS